MFQDAHIEVLIVDDEPNITRLLAHVATGVGFDTLTATTVSDALERIEKNDPDILLLDLKLDSQINAGHIVLDSWLRKRMGPVCIISGFVTRQTETALITRGANNVIPKPILPAPVQAILNRYGREVLKDRHIATLTKELEILQVKMTDMSEKMAKYDRVLRIGIIIFIVLILTILGADGTEILDKLLSIL